MLTDIAIAQQATIHPIEKVAKGIGIAKKYLIPYGRHIAKIDLSLLEKLSHRRRGKYVLVTAITPTPLGEGKTVTTSASMALNRIGKMTYLYTPAFRPVLH